MKNLFRVWSLTAFIFLFAAATAYAAPVITSASINYSNNQITVNGTNLVYGTKTSTVVFKGVNYSANVGTPTKTAVTAQLTGSIVSGTYQVKVVNGYGTSALFDVAYGAVGPQATSLTGGWLSNLDWTSFNNTAANLATETNRAELAETAETSRAYSAETALTSKINAAGTGFQKFSVPLTGGVQTLPAGVSPQGIVFDGTNIWVGGNGSLIEYSVMDGNIIVNNTGDWWVNCTTSFGVAGMASDGTNIWAANGSGNSVTKLKASDGSFVGSYSVGTPPQGIAFDGTNVWVATWSSNNVTKLNASDGSLVGSYSAGITTNGVAFDGTNIWVTAWSTNSVTKLSPSGAVLGTYGVGAQPTAIAFDGTHIWVTNYNGSNVTKLTASGSFVGNYTVGTNPRGIAFDGTNMWVANYGSNSVTKLGLDGTVLGTYSVGSNPCGIAFDGANIWVTNIGSNSVTMIPAQ